jgi:hypothetical protein
MTRHFFSSHAFDGGAHTADQDQIRVAEGRVGEAGSRLSTFSRHPQPVGRDRGRRSQEPFDLLNIDRV